MKPSSAKSTLHKANIVKYRAGNRKCSRCKLVWYRPKGSKKKLCDYCCSHCVRCDALCTTTRSRNYCLKCAAELADNYRKTNDPTGIRNKDYSLRSTYGITINEYEAIKKDQGGACWICQRVPEEGQRKLSVDHLHSKGENKRNPREKRGRIRGLLCWQCNTAIGKFNDSITKLRRAADYLEQWPAQQILKKKEAE